MSEPEQSQTTRPKPFVFVLMPFSKDFNFIYKLIKDACAKVGSYAERVDEQMFEESIVDRICNQITKADVIVADMTGRNPNVFYEAGYAHALGKRVILLTQKTDDIPFDLKHRYHIVYGEDDKSFEPLLDQLPERIKWVIENPGIPLPNRQQIQLELQGTRLVGKPTIDIVPTGRQRSELELSLNLENSREGVIRVAEFKVAIVTGGCFSMMRASQVSRGAPPVDYSTNTISREGQSQKIHFIRDKFILMPGEWESLKLVFDHQCRGGTSKEVLFRLLTDSGEQSYPCILKIRA